MAKNETAPLPRLLSLEEAARELGIGQKSLRVEVYAQRLRCLRATPGRTAKILLHPQDVLDWLAEHAGKRQRAVRPGKAKTGA